MLGSVAFGTAPFGGLPPIADSGTSTVVFASSGVGSTTLAAEVARSRRGIPRIPVEILKVCLSYYVAAWTTAFAIDPASPETDAAFASVIAVLVLVFAKRD
jgi:hypothetical protein